MQELIYNKTIGRWRTILKKKVHFAPLPRRSGINAAHGSNHSNLSGKRTQPLDIISVGQNLTSRSGSIIFRSNSNEAVAGGIQILIVASQNAYRI
jgi:hypothetical protein